MSLPRRSRPRSNELATLTPSAPRSCVRTGTSPTPSSQLGVSASARRSRRSVWRRATVSRSSLRTATGTSRRTWACPRPAWCCFRSNTRLAAPELISIVQAARPKVLVTDRDPGPLADVVARVVTFEEWDVLLDHASRTVAEPPRCPRTTSPLLYFTGGTTGAAEGRDAHPSQPGRELVPQDAGVPLRARRRLPRGRAVLPRRRHRRRSSGCCGWAVRS